MDTVRYERILLSLLIAVLAFVAPLGLAGEAHLMLFVMVFVAMLWVTEAAPLHATAILAAFLLIALVGLEPASVFAQYFDSVIVLLLGGFVIAVAMRVHRLDEYIAYHVIDRAGSDPKWIVLALIATSSFISMWISNSATAAILMPIALVILAKNRLHPGSNFGKACVLAVGYGATIGGIGTIIGSTPNIIAAKFLNDAGVSFGFYDWFYRGFPYMMLLMVAGWLVLITMYKPEKKTVKIIRKTDRMTSDQKKVLAVFALTVALWITESVHGVSSSVVALIPVVLYYFSGSLSTDDFTKIDWATLVLVGGGLALGTGIHATGLDTSFAGIIANAASGADLFTLFVLLGVFGVIMTVIISNTTAAAVYLPIIVALAAALNGTVASVVVVAAIGVSLDFMFPFGTPPTAIAYGTKYVNTKDIAKAGAIISLIGVVLLALMGFFW